MWLHILCSHGGPESYAELFFHFDTAVCMSVVSAACTKAPHFPVRRPVNNFSSSFSRTPTYSFSFVLLILMALSGCKEEKVVAPSPPLVPAGKVKKTVPVFAQPTSGFATLSSATAGPGGRKADVAGKEPRCDAAGKEKNPGVAGEDPAFAKEKGWPVKTPALLPGSILPAEAHCCLLRQSTEQADGGVGGV